MATSVNFVKKLDEINAIVKKCLNGKFKSDANQYVNLTQNGKYAANMKVATSICRKIKPLINKKSLHVVNYPCLLKTIILNNLIIRFRETEKISKK